MGVRFCWSVTGIAATIALLVLIGTVLAAGSAPQEASGAAIAVALCVIPYVFTRAVEGTATAREKTAVTAPTPGSSAA